VSMWDTALDLPVESFMGFMSIDERTIVGTYTDTLTDDKRLIVIQIDGSGQESTMTGTSINHLLAVNDTAALWARHELDISRLDTTILPDILNLTFGVNVMLSYDWEFSANLAYSQINKIEFINLQKIDISTTGAVTMNNTINTHGNRFFHGQLARDGKFMVGVSTLRLLDGTDYYALDAITH
jgi:hypothetical protein